MFGLFYMVITAISSGISGIRTGLINLDSKISAEERKLNNLNPLSTYYDYKGTERDIRTGAIICKERDYLTGDLWGYYNFDKRTKRNFSEEWRKAFYEEKKNNPEPGRTVVNDIEVRRYVTRNNIIWQNNRKYDTKYYCTGQWVKDLHSGQLMVIRNINGNNYYMDIQSRKLIRPTDDEVQKGRLTEKNIKRDIEEWNSIIDSGEWKKKMFYKDPDSDGYWNEYYFYKNNGHSEQSLKEQDQMSIFAPKHA